jgi:transposase InsO family protein
MIHNHLTSGHLGFHKSYGRLRERFWWPGCKSDLARWCKECDSCQRIKGPSDKSKAPLTQLPVGAPLDRVAADVMGPFELTPRGNKYILVITDYFTKWVEAFPLTNEQAPEVAMHIGEFIARLGCPRQFHSDKGSCFIANRLKELCKLLQIDKTTTTSYRPQSDGLVERFNLTLQQMLTAFCNKDKRTDWDLALPYVMMAYRSTPQESTGLSPNILMLGRKLRTPIDLQYPPPEDPTLEYKCQVEYVEWVRQIQREAHESARKHLHQAAERQKRNYDLGSRSYDIQVGSWVYLKDYLHKKTKLHFRWKRPHLVIEQKSPVTYLIQKTEKSKPVVCHVDSLKRCYGWKETKWNQPKHKTVATQWESQAVTNPGAQGKDCSKIS